MSSRTVFYQLIRRDLIVFKREFWPKFIDTVILLFTNVMVFGYLLKQEGLPDGYAAFFVVGAITSFGLIEIVGKVGILLADIEGGKTIFYTLAMPIKTWIAFAYIATTWAMTSILTSILLFPIGKVMVFYEWHWDTMSVWRVALMLISSNLFFGFFALWLTGIVKGMTSLNSLWLRYIAPMWLFGGYVYSWQTAYDLNPVVGYIILLDPMIYAMDGMRSAILGPTGFLPYWVCVLALWAFTAACGIHAIKRLKARLDCI